MLTVITIHGTNATGPAEGRNWWQIGGSLETDISEIAAVGNGEVVLRPFIWDGLNSEKSRRSAASELLSLLQKLESDKQQYVIVGHSHGGSVSALALMEAAYRKLSLPGLMRWITVGTPFIQLRKKRLLFSRVGHLGKATIVAVLSFGLLFSLSFYFNGVRAGFDPFSLMLIFSPAIAIYLAMNLYNTRKLFLYEKSSGDLFRNKFATRWLPLNHSDDEAVEGLQTLRDLRLPLFKTDFIVSPLTFIGAILVPMTPLMIVLSPSLMAYVEQLAGTTNPYGESNDVISSIEFLADILKQDVLNFSKHVIEMAGLAQQHDHFFWNIAAAGLSFITLIVLPVSIMLAATYVFLATVVLVSTVFSRHTSKWLNRAAWGQIRKSAFGNDTQAEHASGAAAHPFWTQESPPVLPPPIAQRISDFADQEAAQSISKLRKAIKVLAFSTEDGDKSDLLADYLTWKELIHTAYFRVPEFRKLIVIAALDHDDSRCGADFPSSASYGEAREWLSQLDLARLNAP